MGPFSLGLTYSGLRRTVEVLLGPGASLGAEDVMKVTITRRCSIQPSIAHTVDAGHVFYGVSSVSTEGTPKGWTRLVGSNSVPFLLPTDAFRTEAQS